MLDDALRGFVASATGGEVVRAERVSGGASRATWRLEAVRDGAPRALVLRHDTGDGPLSGTALTLAREAAVYAALRDTPVRIPRLLAVSPDGRALLVERAPGSDAFAALGTAAERQAVADDCFAALAELHGLDVGGLALPGFARPARPGDHARLDLALWRGIAAQRAPSDALLRLAFDWLEDSAPTPQVRTRLCHGDAGPGNFLFEDGRVTALLDWEFAHLGDPHDDLAWVLVRAQLLGGFGDLARGFAVWSRATGLAIDPQRVAYYRALVLLRMAVSCAVALGHAGARAMDTGVYALLLPYLRRLLPEALEQAGCDDPALPARRAEGEAAVEASPVLRAHARPLDPVPVP